MPVKDTTPPLLYTKELNQRAPAHSLTLANQSSSAMHELPFCVFSTQVHNCVYTHTCIL